MCLPSSKSINSLRRKRPIKNHCLMKAKTFEQQDQKMMMPVYKKSVRFNDCVKVTSFEKISSSQAKDLWFDSSEMANIKSEARNIVSSYRQLAVEGAHASLSKEEYRGFEVCTPLRMKQRLIANGSTIYAYSKGYKPEAIASLYRHCNAWSSKIAFLQAIHDYASVYNKRPVGTANNMESITKALPPISSMIPPQSLPNEIEHDVLVYLQQQRMNSNDKNNKRTRSSLSSPSIAVLHQRQQEQLQKQQQLLTERRVRQRVC